MHNIYHHYSNFIMVYTEICTLISQCIIKTTQGLSCDQWINEIWYILIIVYCSAKNELRIEICYKMDGPNNAKAYYSWWNKADIERQILLWFPCLSLSHGSSLIEQEIFASMSMHGGSSRSRGPNPVHHYKVGSVLKGRAAKGGLTANFSTVVEVWKALWDSHPPG